MKRVLYSANDVASAFVQPSIKRPNFTLGHARVVLGVNLFELATMLSEVGVSATGKMCRVPK